MCTRACVHGDARTTEQVGVRTPTPCVFVPQAFTDVNVKLTGDAAAALLGTDPSTPSADTERPASGEDWSEVQEVALIKAVKTFPKARRDGPRLKFTPHVLLRQMVSDWCGADVSPFVVTPQGCRPNEKERWVLIAAAVPGKSSAQCTKHFAVVKDRLKSQAAAAAPNGANGNGHAAAEEDRGADSGEAGASPEEEEGAGTGGGGGADDWSEMQEILLARALKAHPKGSHPGEKERWVAIAALVPGRSAPQCKAVRGVGNGRRGGGVVTCLPRVRCAVLAWACWEVF